LLAVKTTGNVNDKSYFFKHNFTAYNITVKLPHIGIDVQVFTWFLTLLTMFPSRGKRKGNKVALSFNLRKLWNEKPTIP